MLQWKNDIEHKNIPWSDWEKEKGQKIRKWMDKRRKGVPQTHVGQTFLGMVFSVDTELNIGTYYASFHVKFDEFIFYSNSNRHSNTIILVSVSYHNIFWQNKESLHVSNNYIRTSAYCKRYWFETRDTTTRQNMITTQNTAYTFTNKKTSVITAITTTFWFLLIGVFFHSYSLHWTEQHSQ